MALLTASVPGGATEVTVPGTVSLIASVSWNTIYWLISQTATRFTVGFGTPAPAAGGTLSYLGTGL